MQLEHFAFPGFEPFFTYIERRADQFNKAVVYLSLLYLNSRKVPA
jgi:hypothetical protein